MSGLIRVAIEAAHHEFGIRPERIKGPLRTVPVCKPRFAVCLVAHRLGESYPRIGKAIGRRNHTSAMNAVSRAIEFERDDPSFAEKVRVIMEAAEAYATAQRIARLPAFKSSRAAQ